MFEVLPQAGSLIDQRYEIIEPLGGGGMGAVVKAKELGLGRLVALKFILGSRIADADSMARFEREGQIMGALSHRNIAQFYRCGSWQYKNKQIPYIAMEFVNGRSLREHIVNKQTLSAERVLKIAIQITDALAVAHAHGVVHRDIKPENILLLEAPEPDAVKLIDFGLARILNSEDQVAAQQLTESGILIGSVFYMSPEQCKGKKAEPRSDIYSVGCVLYECLAGEPPLFGDSPIAMLSLHLNEKPAFLSKKTSNHLPDGLEAVIFKAMEKDPALRYQSMSEFKHDLELVAAKQGSGISAPSVAPEEVTRLNFKQWVTVAAVVTLLIVLLISNDNILAAACHKFCQILPGSAIVRGIDCAQVLASLHREKSADLLIKTISSGHGLTVAMPYQRPQGTKSSLNEKERKEALALAKGQMILASYLPPGDDAGRRHHLLLAVVNISDVAHSVQIEKSDTEACIALLKDAVKVLPQKFLKSNRENELLCAYSATTVQRLGDLGNPSGVGFLKELMQRQPATTSAEALNRFCLVIAELSHRQGDVDQALLHLKQYNLLAARALLSNKRIKPEWANDLHYAAARVTVLGVRCHLDKGDRAGAMNWLERSLDTFSGTLDLWCNAFSDAALELMKRNHIGDAIAVLERGYDESSAAENLNREFVTQYRALMARRLVICYLLEQNQSKLNDSLNRLRARLKYLEQSTKLLNDSIVRDRSMLTQLNATQTVRGCLISSLIETQQYQEALNELELQTKTQHLLQKNHTSTPVILVKTLANRAICLMALGRFDEANAAIREADQIVRDRGPFRTPELVEAKLNQTLRTSEKLSFEQRVAPCTNITADEAQFGMARIANSEQRFDDAKKHLQVALRSTSDYALTDHEWLSAKLLLRKVLDAEPSKTR